MAAAQMNVRIDNNLKAAGDAVIAQNSSTPSQVVRALWEYLVVHGKIPRALRGSLDQHAFDASLAEGPTREEPPSGAALVSEFYARLGLPEPAPGPLDYDELKEAAAAEQLAEWGL